MGPPDRPIRMDLGSASVRWGLARLSSTQPPPTRPRPAACAIRGRVDGPGSTGSGWRGPSCDAPGWQLFAGLAGVIAGVVVLATPENSVKVLTVLAGIWLLFMGVVETGTAIRIRAHAKRLPAGM